MSYPGVTPSRLGFARVSGVLEWWVPYMLLTCVDLPCASHRQRPAGLKGFPVPPCTQCLVGRSVRVHLFATGLALSITDATDASPSRIASPGRESVHEILFRLSFARFVKEKRAGTKETSASASPV